MKWAGVPFGSVSNLSLPVRGAWIEIFILIRLLPVKMSLPVRGAWIEMYAVSVSDAGI